jgi:hypothetical protein
MRTELLSFVALLALPALALQTPAAPASTAHRVFVVDTVSQTAVTAPGLFGSVNTSTGELHTAPLVMKEMMKRCPGTIVLTTDRSTAEYVLAAQMRSSVLTNAKGDVLYMSPAIKYQNTAKDVCKYIATH